MLLLCLSLFSCIDEKNPAKDYGSSVIGSLKTTKQVEKKVDLLSAQRAIQEFQAANGRNPADLAEVAQLAGAPLPADRYAYDPATGALTERPRSSR